jgi:hypothetical protein
VGDDKNDKKDDRIKRDIKKAGESVPVKPGLKAIRAKIGRRREKNGK